MTEKKDIIMFILAFITHYGYEFQISHKALSFNFIYIPVEAGQKHGGPEIQAGISWLASVRQESFMSVSLNFVHGVVTLSFSFSNI